MNEVRLIDVNTVDILQTIKKNSVFAERIKYAVKITLDNIPTADVIEREKIEKAIDEMGKLASQPISLDQKDAIDMCIKILKRNIEG